MIDIEKFICSLLADHPEGITVRGDIHRALKEQGLEYKDGKIVPIEDKTELKESEDERIRKELIKETKGSEVRLFETVTNDEFITWLEKQGEQEYTLKSHNDDAKDILAWLEKQSKIISANSCKTCKDEQKPIKRKDFISIPFGTDSELVNETITIPDGCVATIEGNKIHIKKK